MKWSVETKRLDLQYDWNISRNSSAYKVNVFVTLESEGKHYIGECAPNIRFDETPEKMAEVFQGLDLAMVKNASLEQTLAFLKETILYPSLRFAIETAYLAYYVQKKGQTIPELLSLSPPKAKKTAYTLPILTEGQYSQFIVEYELDMFDTWKVKMGKEGVASELTDHIYASKKWCILDPNEAFDNAEDLIQVLEAFPKEQILFVEQPFPAHLKDVYSDFRTKCDIPVVMDESITSYASYVEQRDFCDGINVKMMKVGSLFEAKRILEAAKQDGKMTMMGCMVETSLAISQAFYLSGLADVLDLDSFMYLTKDPFGKITEHRGVLLLKS